VKILVLNGSQMRRVFSMEEAIRADKDALRLYSQGQCCIPLRAGLKVPEAGAQSLYMYGYVAPAQALGVKIVSVFPGNAARGLGASQAVMVLADSATGQVCALLDGPELTRIRTGAVSGAASDLLARPDSRVFALFGTGSQAEAQMEAVLAVRPIRRVWVWGRSAGHTEAFVERMAAKFGSPLGVSVAAASSAAQAVEGADLITTVTSSRQPVFDGRLVRPGTHVNAIGSYTPEMAETDQYLVTHADKVYVDTRDGALHEAGDLIQPIRSGAFRPEQITGELGEVLCGRAPGRLSDREITYFKSTGSAVLDLVTARRIYESALRQGVGTTVEL